MPDWVIEVWVMGLLGLVMGWVMCKTVEAWCDTIQARDADRQMERDLEERRCSEEMRE
jgi:hypothetical protein